MGSVFLAEHALIKRRVAIKVLHSELATDPNVIERFMNEARAAGTLGHPNIVESTDMGFTSNHVPYIVFEYLEGTLLTDEVYRVCGLPVRRVIHIAQQIASALHAAHNAGVVHRDLKSDNIFLTDKDDALDHVKVLDFGISRFLEIEDERSRGLVMGTPEFMAPEQITAPESVDKRADIYALGVIMYEMLTARRPFSDDDARALMARIVHEPPPPIEGGTKVPPELVELIMERMLPKDPARRFQTMMEVEQGLEAVLADANIPQRQVSNVIPRPVRGAETPWPPPQHDTIQPLPVMKHAPAANKPWLLYGLAGVGLLMGGVGLIFGLRSGGGSEQAMVTPPPAPAPLPATAVPPAEPKAPSKVQISLDANTPDARVTFRRRVAPTPVAMQVTTSDVVELVEVSAPGFKTMRYWLTFDRPTHLTAHLAKGNGLAEATEEQTLIALGELSTPELTKPVATPAVAVAVAPHEETKVAKATPIVATPTKAPVVAARTAPITPRKIGHAAAEETVAAPPPAAIEPTVVTKVEEKQPAEVTPAVVMPTPAPIIPQPVVPVAPPPAPVVVAKAATKNVLPAALEALRTAGDRQIGPDEISRAEIARSGKDKVMGAFKICVGADGAINQVATIKSTGWPAYDSRIAEQAKSQWHYKPFMADGSAVPVCSAVTFVYKTPK